MRRIPQEHSSPLTNNVLASALGGLSSIPPPVLEEVLLESNLRLPPPEREVGER